MNDTITELCEAIDKLESRSSLHTKIEPALRRQIVAAVINRNPPTLREVFDHFDLAVKGVSYTAFYYWARKIKRFASLLEMSQTLEDKEDCAGMLPRILASRMLDNALDDQVDVLVLRRLMETYRMACSIEIAKRRLEYQSGQWSQRRELDKAAGDKDILRLARLIAKTQRQKNRDEALSSAAPPTAHPTS